MSVPDIDAITRRANALAALVESRLPIEVDVSGPADSWPLVAPALLAHATGTLRSIMLLAPVGAHNDASRLLRSLYDHVVTFAWLAADPSAKRLGLWRLEDLVERLKADKEAAAAGEPLLDAASRMEMQEEVEGVKVKTPDLASKAFAADRYWAEHVAAIEQDSLRSFLGLYTFLFRNYSGLVHATFRGLNRVNEELSPTRRRVLIQAPLEGHAPYGMSTAVYGLGLSVASVALGWPSEVDIKEAFARHTTE